MRFDVSIAHEAAWTRVGVIGEPTLGRLLSLLQVLEVDSTSWPHSAVLLDLRGLRCPLPQQEQARFCTEALHALRRVGKIAVLASGSGRPECGALHVFDDAEAAVKWLRG